MSFKTKQQKKSSFPCLLVLLIFLTVAAAVTGLSINLMRNGQPGFVTNLVNIKPNFENDPYLRDNPNTLQVPTFVKTILFMGSDYTEGGGYRTDVLLLAAFNTRTGKINLISFPRDLWVNIPGVSYQRINTAHQSGGDQLLGDTFAANFGFRPDHYAMINFNSFRRLITMLDGVDVEVAKRTEDSYGDYEELWRVIEPGTVHMDEGLALWYVRARKNSTDFDRNRRGQEMLKAMIKKAIRPDQIKKWPELYKFMRQEVLTDMEPSDLFLYAVPLSKYLDKDLITTFQIKPEDAPGFITDGGAQVLQPNIQAIQNTLEFVFWIR